MARAAAASLPTAPRGRASVRARPGGWMARTPTLGAAAARPTGLRPRRPRSGCPRRRPATDPAPAAPAPYLPAAPEPVQARVDDDPLTSPHFARGAAGPDDSRSYRTPGAILVRGRTVRAARPTRARRTATPARPRRTRPAIRRLRRLPGRRAGCHRPGHQPGRAIPQRGPARGRDSYAGPARDSYTDPPAAMSPIQGRPTAAGATRRPPAGTATRPARPTAPTRARHARTWARRVPTPARHGPIRAPGPAQAGGAAPPPARPRPARRRARPPVRLSGQPRHLGPGLGQ